jgi:hypothetical protein
VQVIQFALDFVEVEGADIGRQARSSHRR